MPSQTLLPIRLVIPQSLQRGGVPVYEHAVDFFLRKGEKVYPQERLLKLSKSLPAIVEGDVGQETFEAFLVNFPELDKIVVLAGPAAARKALAA